MHLTFVFKHIEERNYVNHVIGLINSTLRHYGILHSLIL